MGLCSLASVQSQPRDTGLYQVHMCALLQLTHISSFVTVTKPARLGWEMCRLWLTAHVCILYFESHAGLSNTGSVKASLTLLSSTGSTESCSRFTALTTCSLIYVALCVVCLCACTGKANEYYLTLCCSVVLLPKLSPRCWHAPPFPRKRKIWKENVSKPFFSDQVLARLPTREKKGGLYTLIRSVTKITSRKLF